MKETTIAHMQREREMYEHVKSQANCAQQPYKEYDARGPLPVRGNDVDPRVTIGNAFTDLGAVLDGLHVEIDELEMRLAPIRTPSGPEGDSTCHSPTGPAAPLSPVASVVRQCHERVLTANRRLAMLRARIEL